jgi:hypothetical protein
MMVGLNGLSAMLLVRELNTVNNYVIVQDMTVSILMVNVRVNHKLKHDLVIIRRSAVIGITLIIGRIVLLKIIVVGKETDGEEKFVYVVVYSNQMKDVNLFQILTSNHV